MEERNYSKELMKEMEKPIKDRKEFENRRGKKFIPRKNHLSKVETGIKQRVWEDEIESISSDIKRRAGSKFFNPFRGGGPYYGAVQALYLLGANKYHSYFSLFDMMKRVMSGMNTKKLNENKELIDSWTWFANKKARNNALKAKDLAGRIHDNMKTLQRLGGVNPYGYKLKQLCVCIDIRRIKSKEVENGEWEYRLNTKFSSTEDVKPYYFYNFKKTSISCVGEKKIKLKVVNRSSNEVIPLDEEKVETT